jgi:hypothetical protein
VSVGGDPSIESIDNSQTTTVIPVEDTVETVATEKISKGDKSKVNTSSGVGSSDKKRGFTLKKRK